MNYYCTTIVVLYGLPAIRDIRVNKIFRVGLKYGCTVIGSRTIVNVPRRKNASEPNLTVTRQSKIETIHDDNSRH